MSNRLTYSSTSETPAWTRLVLPATLLLAAIALLGFANSAYITVTNRISIPLQTLMCLILVALSAWLNQETLPEKTPEGSKALATAIGGPLTLVLLYPHVQMLSLASLIGAALMLAGWLFFLNAPNRSIVWILASGLCGGLAVSMDPMTLSGLIPLAVWNVVRISKDPKKSLRAGLLWLLALTAGFAPLFLGILPLPSPYFDSFTRTPLPHSIRLVWQHFPPAAIPFLFIGLLIACLQKQPVVLGLVLCTFLLRLLLTGFRPIEESLVDPGLLLPAIWGTSYGVLRVMRGVEQGIRNVNSANAKRFSAAATLVCVLVFCAWTISRFLIA